MGRLSKALLISLMYTALAIILDAVSIYYFKLNAPVTVVITTFLAVFGLTFEYLHATKRSELRFAERRKLQVECAKFSMMWDVLDLDTKLRFYKKSMEIVNPVSLTTDTSYCRTKFDIGKKK